jgi:RND family efflux transporter MFP subunit
MLKRILQFIKRHPIWTILLLLLLVGLFFLFSWLFSSKGPEYITVEATQGDLAQTVEVVGEVVSDRDLGLQFPLAGVVSNVLVNEGDQVAAGQTLAQLRAGRESANVSAQRALLDAAVADLRNIEAGSRPEDIAIAQADVQNKLASLAAARSSQRSAQQTLQAARANLTALELEVGVSLGGQITTAVSSAAQQLSAARSALAVADSILGDPTVRTAVRNDSYLDITLLNRYITDARSAIDGISTSNTTDYSAAISTLNAAVSAVSTTSQSLATLRTSIGNLALGGSFNRTVRDGHVATFTTQETTVQGILSAVNGALTSLQNASAGLDTRISNEQSAITNAQGSYDRATADIATFQSLVAIAQAQLDKTQAGARPSELDAARARVRQAQANVYSAGSAWTDTQLKAPVEGLITKVNVKAGEFSPVGPAVNMLGTSPFRMELFVSEIDVPKLTIGQEGTTTLEAFPGINYAMKVSGIDSDTTDRDGTPKYKVLLDFVYEHPEFKVGMTGDATIITDSRSAVVSVPGRAVLKREDGTEYIRIRKDAQTVIERDVTLGINGADGLVEVMKGVSAGEEIIVLEKE